jgi:suppressor of ftsI/bilirubin oxidase
MEIPSMQAATLASGEEFTILKLVVNHRVLYDRTIPMMLSSMSPLDTRDAAIRPITLSRVMDMSADGALLQWLINGLTYQIDANPIVVQRNTTEIWEIHNEAQSMPHAMHLHGFHFQVLGRTHSPAQVRNQAVDGRGRAATDLGWKDTVLVWPGETVRIAVHFAHPFDGE